MTLITPYGAIHNKHYLSVVQNELTLSCFFYLTVLRLASPSKAPWQAIDGL